MPTVIRVLEPVDPQFIRLLVEGPPGPQGLPGPPGDFRTALTANATFYVEETGSDTTGDGSVATPFRTLQHAHDQALLLDCGAFRITIQLGVGNFGPLNTNRRMLGESAIILGRLDDAAAPGARCLSVIDGGSTANAVDIAAAVTITLGAGIKLINSKVPGGCAIAATDAAKVNISGEIEYGDTGDTHNYTETGAYIFNNSPFTIKCSAPIIRHIWCRNMSNNAWSNNPVVTIVGELTVTQGFVDCVFGSYLNHGGATFVDENGNPAVVHGPKYHKDETAVVRHGSSLTDDEFYPGDLPGKIDRSLTYGDLQTIATDAGFTLTPTASPRHTIHTGILTADRTVVLSNSHPVEAQLFRITRAPATSGPYKLNVQNQGGAAIVSIGDSDWAEFVWDRDNAKFKLSAFGSTATVAAYEWGRNVIINGAGRVHSGSAGAVGDVSATLFNKWFTLTQTGNVTPSVLSNVADGMPTMMRLTNPLGSAQRMGLAQIIKSDDCRWLRGQKVVLSGKASREAGSATGIYYALLGWTGTADPAIFDLVNDWTSTDYTLGAFFVSTNMALYGVGHVASGAGTLVALPALAATLGSTFNNLIVFAWTGTVAQANVGVLDLALQLEKGDFAATAQEFRPVALEAVLAA